MSCKNQEERRTQLDERIMKHPFLCTFTCAQRKTAEQKKFLPLFVQAQRISQTENGALPQIEGFTEKEIRTYWKLRQSFLRLVTENQGVFQLLQFTIAQAYANCSGDRSVMGELDTEEKNITFKRALGDARDYLALKKTSRKTAFDGVAYTEALWDSIKAYDDTDKSGEAQKNVTFLGLFAACYEHRLKENEYVQRNIGENKVPLPEEKRKILSQISDYLNLKNIPCTVENLSPKDGVYEQVVQRTAEVLDMNPEKIRVLLPLLQRIRAGSLDAPVGDEEESSIQEMVPDLETIENTSWDRIEKQDMAFRFIQAVCKKKMKEYNQMLMTNLLLYPLHPVAGMPVVVAGAHEYAEEIKKNSAGLYDAVFRLDYLRYIEWRRQKAPNQEADPAEVEVLCYGYPLKDLNAKSIANFKGVTSANVTYYSKNFTVLLAEIAEQELE